MRSLWLEECGEATEDLAPPLQGREEADVCIVGGGFTGLWTAVQIKRLDPSCRVVLLEADICGGGASGRNGGFVLTWSAKYQTLEKMFGPEGALAVLDLCEQAPAGIADFCTEHGIDARLRHEGWLWTASNRAQLGAWRSTREALERCGRELLHDISSDEVRRLTGSPRQLAGVMVPNAATVDPGRLVRGLRRVAMRLGVRIHEKCPMRRLGRGSPATVATPAGEVEAARVVLAMNAWSPAVRELRRSIVVVGSDVIATPPVPEELARLGLAHGTAISDSRLFTHYYRSTHDGRLVFGKGGGDFAFGSNIGRLFEGPSRHEALVERVARWFYPSFDHAIRFRSWSGPIDRSMTGLPMFGELSGCSSIIYGYGYSGNGVGPSFVGGRILASLALGRVDEWASAPLVGMGGKRFPPEPVRYLGARLMKGALMRTERAEDEGRSPRRVDIALSALMPGGLVPVQSREKS